MSSTFSFAVNQLSNKFKVLRIDFLERSLIFSLTCSFKALCIVSLSFISSNLLLIQLKIKSSSLYFNIRISTHLSNSFTNSNNVILTKSKGENSQIVISFLISSSFISNPLLISFRTFCVIFPI